MDKRWIALSLVAVFSGASLAAGAPPTGSTETLAQAGGLGAGVEGGFEEVDLNDDGYISLEEAERMEGLVDAFKELDQNQDGMLSPAEFAVFEEQQRGRDGGADPLQP